MSSFWKQAEKLFRKTNKGTSLSCIKRYVKKLAEYGSNVVVNKKNVERIDEILTLLDDVIDELEKMEQKANFIRRVSLNKILTILLTVQFTLSNKAANYVGRKNRAI